VTYAATLAAAAVKVAASLGLPGMDPVILADGANVIVHLSPAPVVAKVAASTPAVRPDNAAWLQRELDVAGFLAGRGIPVMTPSPEVPPVVHHGDGQVMSFWRYLSPSRPQTRLTAGQAAAVAAAYARLTARLDHDRDRPLHGDAGAGNLMAAGTGWVWHDFEDTCTGPAAWDLAASTASPRLDASRILAAYGEPADPAQLEVCQQLRKLHLTVWYNLYAERLPDLAPRAAELLTLWPEP